MGVRTIPNANNKQLSFSGFYSTLCGLASLLLAGLGTFALRVLAQRWPDNAERVVQIAAVGAAVAAGMAVVAYCALWRRSSSPQIAGLVALTVVAIVLVTFYLTWVMPYIAFPADILIWSEGDFVNDIVKIRIGYPLYTAQVNNDSFHYTPGTQVLTYGIATVFGAPDSIPVYRTIQIGFNTCTALLAFGCVLRLLRLADIRLPLSISCLLGAFGVPFLFLVTANSITNPFAHNLHNDALAQFISVFAYWLLLGYALTESKWTLLLMAILPASGFMVKQNLAIWMPLYTAFLLAFSSTPSLKKTIIFSVASFACLGLVIACCLSKWGEPFWYWTVREMAGHVVSPLRSVHHFLAAWIYYAVGLAAGVLLIRRGTLRPLLGVWIVWLIFLFIETYTSGIEWMLNHMGPGSLLAAEWFLASFAYLWANEYCRQPDGVVSWLRCGASVGIVSLACAGMGLIYMPIDVLPHDAYRYVAAIEKECAYLPPDKVLLDLGCWITSKNNVVARDQAPGVGTRGSSRDPGDFSGILARLRAHQYDKILVRNPRAPGFWYDNRSGWWPQATGIRKALFENYHEIGRIRGVEGEKRFLMLSFEPVGWNATRYGFQEISVFVPNGAKDELQ